MTRLALLVALALAGCGTSRAPLPPPVSPISATPALAAPDDTSAWAAQVPTLPEIRTITLASGITVQLVPRHDAPVVYTILVGRGAHGRTDDATAAIDALVERALGAGLPRALGEVSRDDHVVAARATGRGLFVSSGVVPTEIDRVLERFAQLVEGRGFDDAEIERSRAALLEHARFETGQRRRRSHPPASEELFTRLYGEGDARVAASRILAARVEPLTLARVRARVAQFLRPESTALIVVGDFDPADLESRIRARWDALVAPPSTPPRAALQAPAFPTPDPRLRIYPTDDDPRAVLRLVERGPPRDHEDYAAFCVLARLAGGMFSAAINLRFREQRGDTYGVAARVIDEVDHTLLEIQMVVPVATVGDAASNVVAELERLSDASRITAEELSLARNVELARRAGRFDSAWGSAYTLAVAFMVGDAPEAILATSARIERVTAEEVATVARRWVRPDHAPMVIIGAWSWMISHPVRVPGGVSIIGL
ncbi:M16 family metallopeptidase [Sandaracinus amylolyticus]|uniref:Peptidase, M16 family n=1 Tax=Sandaracinus amylolyticus TaxID=927083 RepID=A0A0F6SHS4_9BACT|nr:insulinase family protein [Sandaracinus amylolyticus]AKF10949.1 Peptidase, M16 family [Sandaracinus amylolyticus]